MKREATIAAAAAILLASVPADAQTSDYDSDDDGLIESSHLAQPDTRRWGLGGNGVAGGDTGGAAFPGASETMGCPGGICSGYELVRALGFANNTSYTVEAAQGASSMVGENTGGFRDMDEVP